MAALVVEPQASLEESVVVEASARWVTVQVSHGHKFRVGEWMQRRFPGSERVGNGRDVVVYGAESPAAMATADAAPNSTKESSPTITGGRWLGGRERGGAGAPQKRDKLV